MQVGGGNGVAHLMWSHLGAQLLLCMQVYMYVCTHEVTCITYFRTIKTLLQTDEAEFDKQLSAVKKNQELLKIHEAGSVAARKRFEAIVA